MRTYIADIIPKIQRYSEKLDNLTLLTNQHWVVIDDIDNTKTVYIFRGNNELLISRDGKVTRARWEYLGYNSLLIDQKDESYLFKHGFFDENILALKLDSKDEYAFLVNETKQNEELNTSERVIAFLNQRYVENYILNNIQNTTGLVIEQNTNRVEAVYKCPEFIKTRIEDDYTIWTGNTATYKIEFNDKLHGRIYVKKKTNEAFFKDKSTLIFAIRVEYLTLDDCINGLHYFLKNGNVLKSKGYLGSFS